MTGMLRMRRSRGVVSGFLLVLLGLWGALIAFIGPYFHYAYTPDPGTAWTYDTARLWLEILPGAAVFLGGILLIIAAGRHTAVFGALLAAAAGAWFALGTVLSPLWNNGVPLGGMPASSTVLMRAVEQIGFFTGLGVAIVFVAAAAMGRILSLPAEVVAVPEVVPVPAENAVAETEPATTLPVRTGLFRSRRGTTEPAETEPVKTETVS